MGRAATGPLLAICQCRLSASCTRVRPSLVTFARLSSSSSATAAPTTSLATRISNTLSLPCFTVPTSRVELLDEPAEFYAALLAGIGRAKQQIFVSSLYIGKSEVELIRSIAEALERNPALRATILVDALRSTREGPYDDDGQGPATESCASLLAGLQRQFPDRANVRLFRAAGLPKWLEWLVGKRFVEGWGLQHMKVYGFDDEVVITGANLSNDYFTNRRDRYLIVKGDKPLADYLCQLVDTVAAFSYRLVHRPSQDQRVEEEGGNGNHAAYRLEWDGAGRGYSETGWQRALKERIEALTSEWREATLGKLQKANGQQEGNKTEAVEVVPLLQMGPMGIQHETDGVPMVLDQADELSSDHAQVTSKLDLTTGYFSLNPLYAGRILSSKATSDIITASPQANGFFGSKGVSRHLPAAYTWLEGRFWKTAQARGRGSQISIREWAKQGWTYHCKGIWLTEPSGISQPSLTLLGSSNFGIRSAQLDLECTLLVDATKSPHMRKRLARELSLIRKDANDEVGWELLERPDRKVHWGVKLAASLIKRML